MTTQSIDVLTPCPPPYMDHFSRTWTNRPLASIGAAAAGLLALVISGCGGGGGESGGGGGAIQGAADASAAEVSTPPLAAPPASSSVGGVLATVACDMHQLFPYLRIDLTGYIGSKEQSACNAAPRPPTGQTQIMIDFVAFDEAGAPLELSLDDSTFSESTTGEGQAFFFREAYRVSQAAKVGAYSAFLGFDQSGSIATSDPSNTRIDAGLLFLGKNAAPDEVGVGSFSNGGARYFQSITPNGIFSSTPATDFTTTLNDFKSTIGGDTPLYDAAIKFTNIANDKSTTPNKAVVIFSDGKDTASKSTRDDAVDNAAQKKVPIYTFALQSTDQDFVSLQRLAQDTGGAYLAATQAKQLIAMYGSLGSLLRRTAPVYRTFWNLKVTPTTAANSGCFPRPNQTPGVYPCTVVANMVIKTPKGDLIVPISYKHGYRVLEPGTIIGQ